MSSIRGVSVVKVRVQKAGTSSYAVLPVIMIEGEGVLASHAQYLYQHKRKSITWLNDNARAVGLFLRYTINRHNDFEDPVSMFREFRDDLETGTIDRQGEDPTGLYWKARRSKNVETIIRYITQFSDWQYDKANRKAIENNEDVKAVLINPWRKATSAEKYVAYAAYHNRVSRAFLSYTFDGERAFKEADTTREVRVSNHDYFGTQDEDVYKFPDDRIWDLCEAFKLPGARPNSPIHKRLNLRNVLITLLLHFGARRVSEPFHLYMCDIMRDPANQESALVKLHHPSNSPSPVNEDETRRDYLAKCGLRPRNDNINPKNYHSGFKNLALNDKGYTIVQWFPAHIGIYFMALWNLYVEHQRIPPKKGEPNHPFAFTNQYGQPASRRAYRDAHNNAVRAIGLVPKKELGTTPHGHRHTALSNLKDADVDPLVIKNVAAHRSIESQRVYQNKSNEEIREELEVKSKNLKAPAEAGQPLELVAPDQAFDMFMDVDPLGLFLK